MKKEYLLEMLVKWNMRSVSLLLVMVLLVPMVANFAYAAPTQEPTPQISESPVITDTPEPSPSPTQTPRTTQALEDEYSDLLIKMGDSGDKVISLQMRLRDLGYYTYKITGEFGGVTKQAVIDFQDDNNLKQDGIVGGKTATLLYSIMATRTRPYNRRLPTPSPTPTPTATPKPTKVPVKTAIKTGKKTSTKTSTKTKEPKKETPSNGIPKYGKIIEWNSVKGKVGRGGKFLVCDFYTRKTYYMVRVGGSLHMDVEPATKKDTATFKSTYGGKWSWNRRPVLCKIGGTWYAASTNGMPHGYETVSGNGMDGQVCIHFKNSRTHAHNAIDPDHKRCVNIAGGK